MEESLVAAAKQKWTRADDQYIVRNWHEFEKNILKKQRWSWQKLNVSTLQTFQAMYLHLQERVRFGETKYDVAVEQIRKLSQELDDHMRGRKMAEDLKEQLVQLKEFMASQGDHRESSTSRGSGVAVETFVGSSDCERENEKTCILQAQLQVVVSEKKEVEESLKKTRSCMEASKISAEKSAREVHQSATASNDQLRDLENKLQGTKAELDQSGQQLEELRLASRADEAQQHTLIRDLESQLVAEERTKAAVLQRVAELEELLRIADDRHIEDQDMYVRAQDNVRELFDQCQDLKGNLRVMCRIRPRLNAADDELEDLRTTIGSHSDHLQVIEMAKRSARSVEDVERFEMERVFEKSERNEQIFNEVGQLIGSAINGRNVCIFAYGQTGSGKTHTMNYPWNEGFAPQDDVDYGIIPRSVERISSFMKTNKGIWKLSVTGKYVEIYAENIFDLLRRDTKTAPKMVLKFTKLRGIETYKAESMEVDLTEEGDFQENVRELLDRASSNRRVRATAYNSQSSRSHSVMTLKIVAQRIDGKFNAKTEGLLNLIDLAGSETPDAADKESQREGININKSLTVLRKVLGEMASSDTKHISFKESMLTKLLKSSLAGDCKTLMFVMVSPLAKDREETRNTLKFAVTAQQVRLKSYTSGPAGNTPNKKV